MMSNIGLEWVFDNKEYEQHWRDFTGEPLPLLPVGSKIELKKNDGVDRWFFLLQVKEIKAHFNPDDYAFISMVCDVISVLDNET